MLTILIPTYNRKAFLNRLLQSLTQQTNANFRVLIMDDGSIDQTKTMVDTFLEHLNIEYHYHDNMGKSKTLVESMRYLQDEYVYLLDSDAILKPNAVDIILRDIYQYKEDASFGGLFYCMEYPDGKIIGQPFKNPNIKTDFQKALDFDAQGDKAIIMKIAYLKQIEMPIFEDEKFITESVFMNRLALLCHCICSNESIMITDYQDDGLTANIKNFWKLYPKGYHLFFLERINDHTLPFKKYIQSMIALIVFAIRSKKGYIYTWKQLRGWKHKCFYCIFTPFGFICNICKII